MWRCTGAALAVAILGGAAIVAIRLRMIDRVLHPQRYAVSGDARLPLDRYADAARIALGGRLARLALPVSGGPVIASGARTVFLDPPTARVLGITGRDGVDGWLHPPLAGPQAMADPAQPPQTVADHARAQVRGGRLTMIDWPTARNPDWTVTFTGGGGSVAIKVADDTGGAIAAPAR